MGFALDEVRPISPPMSALLLRALGNLLFYIAKPLGFALLNRLASVWVMNELEMSWQLVFFFFFWAGDFKLFRDVNQNCRCFVKGFKKVRWKQNLKRLNSRRQMDKKNLYVCNRYFKIIIIVFDYILIKLFLQVVICPFQPINLSRGSTAR